MKNEGTKLSNIRLIVSGDIVELYNYERPYVYNRPEKARDIIRSPRPDRREDNLTVAQRYLRRVIFANVRAFSSEPSFVTFTFAENICDVKVANGLWTEFVRKLRRRCGRPIHYSVVTEFQKRGAIHYHVLFYDLPNELQKERSTREIATMWGHGWVDMKTIQKIRSIRSIGAYVSKYLTKHTLDARLVGEKAYFSSRGLVKPREIRDIKRAKVVLTKLKSLHNYKMVYNNDYDTGRSYGVINYKQYQKIEP